FQTLLGISDFAAANSGKPIMYTEWNAGGGKPCLIPKHSARPI
ncbi:hypothetical protein, partial [Alistipes sp.]